MNATDSAADLGARWFPTDTAVAHAKAMLDAEPDADLAAIPMVQPGKSFGWWMVGQLVETVEDVVFLGVNSRGGKGRGLVPNWSEARNLAAEAASVARGDRPGTVAYAVVTRDGHVSVFEDIL